MPGYLGYLPNSTIVHPTNVIAVGSPVHGGIPALPLLPPQPQEAQESQPSSRVQPTSSTVLVPTSSQTNAITPTTLPPASQTRKRFTGDFWNAKKKDPALQPPNSEQGGPPEDPNIQFTQGNALALYSNFAQGFGLGVIITALRRYTQVSKKEKSYQFMAGHMLEGKGQDGHYYRLHYLPKNESRLFRNFFYQNPIRTNNNPKAQPVGIFRSNKTGAFGRFSGYEKVGEINNNIENILNPHHLDVTFFQPGNKTLRYESNNISNNNKGMVRLTWEEPGKEPVSKTYKAHVEPDMQTWLMDTGHAVSPKPHAHEIIHTKFKEFALGRAVDSLFERSREESQRKKQERTQRKYEAQKNKLTERFERAQHVLNLRDANKPLQAWLAQRFSHSVSDADVNALKASGHNVKTFVEHSLEPERALPKQRLNDVLPFNVTDLLSLPKRNTLQNLVHLLPEPEVAIGWGIVGGVATSIMGSWVQANQVNMNLLQSFSDTENNHHPSPEGATPPSLPAPPPPKKP
jgi:hypothetical protein